MLSFDIRFFPFISVIHFSRLVCVVTYVSVKPILHRRIDPRRACVYTRLLNVSLICSKRLY